MLDGFNNVLKWFGSSSTTVTERMGLARDTGDLTLNTGNLVIGTSGKGIDFSNASAPTGGSYWWQNFKLSLMTMRKDISIQFQTLLKCKYSTSLKVCISK